MLLSVNSVRAHLTRACISVLLLCLGSTGSDRIQLQSDSTLFGSIGRETADSVYLVHARQDTVLARADIASITYSRADFESPLRLVAFDEGSAVRRASRGKTPERDYVLFAGDTLQAGPDSHLGAVFAGGMQFSMSPGSRAAILCATGDREEKPDTVEIVLLAGSVFLTTDGNEADEIEAVVHTPNATVRFGDATCMAQYHAQEQISLVGVRSGFVGVRLSGSDIGEVVVHADECVRMSGVSKKIMQDELTKESARQLASVAKYFAQRVVDEVKEPRRRQRRERAESAGPQRPLLLTKGDFSLSGRERLWIMPQVCFDATVFVESKKRGFVPAVSAGFNPRPWLLPFVQVGYRMAQLRERSDSRIELLRSTRQVISSAGAAALYERGRAFGLTALSSTWRAYIGNTVNEEPVEAPATHVVQINLDACVGLRFRALTIDCAYRLVSYSEGLHHRLGAGFNLRVFNGRLIIGAESQSRFYADHPEFIALVNIASDIRK